MLNRFIQNLYKELLAKNQELIDLKATLEDKIKHLEAAVATKDEELKKKERQYNKCMEKAKSALEPTAAPGLDNAKSEEMETARAVREMEDKLLQSASYQYSLAIHHNAVEARNRTQLGQHRQSVASRRKSEI